MKPARTKRCKSLALEHLEQRNVLASHGLNLALVSIGTPSAPRGAIIAATSESIRQLFTM